MKVDLETLRAATEDDVEFALTDAYVSLPIATPADLLEAFNCMLDHLTGERDAADFADDAAVAAARARNLPRQRN